MTASFPEWVEPMAATLTQERFTGPEWIFERKLDGIRLLAFKNGPDVRLFSRNRLPQNIPSFVQAIENLPVREVILDGEATWDLGVAYHVFDIMWLDGRDVTMLPLEARRALLSGLPLQAPLHRVPSLDDSKPWERACQEGWEGVIAKRRDSLYERRRSPHWLKMKCEESQELVVGGFTDPQGGRVGLGALLVGYFEGDDFIFAGKVGTGFDTKLLLDLRARLDALAIAQAPFTKAVGLPRKGAHWARPEIVVQVAFIEWTAHGKLRHSRLLGVRFDKAAREVVREVPSAKSSGLLAAPKLAGRQVRAKAGGLNVITHPEKVLFPPEGNDAGITKGELAAYYETIAPVMVPHIRARPITMERYPAGIDKKGFWQKDVSKGFPEWLERIEVPKKDGTVHHPLVTDTRSLLWVTNQNTVTQHVWTSRAPNLYYPDVCVFDLDPSEDDPEPLRAATLAVRDLLNELGLPSSVKTSGSKGFHILVALDGKANTGDVARFAHAVGALLVKRDPQHLTQEFSKVDRGGRIYVDTGRNGYSATFAAAYTVRAKPGAPVSAPCTWEELERGEVGPRTFTLRTMAGRIAEVGDPWADMHRPIGPARRSSNVKKRSGGSSLQRAMKLLKQL